MKHQINRSRFMEFFRRDDFHQFMTSDDCVEIFLNALAGSSDITDDLIEQLKNNYSVSDTSQNNGSPEVTTQEPEELKLYYVNEYGYYRKECGVMATSREEAKRKADIYGDWENIFEVADFTDVGAMIDDDDAPEYDDNPFIGESGKYSCDHPYVEFGYGKTQADFDTVKQASTDDLETAGAK